MISRFPLILTAFSCCLCAATLAPEQDQKLAHDIYKQLVEIQSGYTTGSTTLVAEAVAARLRAAGFPQADIFTLFYEPSMVSPLIRSRNVIPSFLNPLRKFHRGLLPLMPLAVESFDLRKYDLVISSESGPAKGVITSASTRHFCYCHTPMRYLWELYPVYRNEFGSAFQRIAIHASLYLV